MLTQAPKIRQVCQRHGSHVEHYCCIMYAGCEVFELHSVIYIVSVLLLGFGLVVEVVKASPA